jgi:hypothetical protein
MAKTKGVTQTVDWEKFLHLYLRVQAAGGTTADLAREAGITQQTVNGRVDKMRNVFKLDIPKLKSANTISGYEISKLQDIVKSVAPDASRLRKPPVL